MLTVRSRAAGCGNMEARVEACVEARVGLTDFEGKFLRHGGFWRFLVLRSGEVGCRLADGQRQRGRDANMTVRFLSSGPHSNPFTAQGGSTRPTPDSYWLLQLPPRV